MEKTRIPRGQEIFVSSNGGIRGCMWKGIYQVETTIFWIAPLGPSVMFGMTEWDKVKDSDSIEMVKGRNLIRRISGDVARKYAYKFETDRGDRIGIPKVYWEEAKEG